MPDTDGPSPPSSFEDLLEALAARTPAPAGACAAAWTAALAAALLEMVAQFAQRPDVAGRGRELRGLLLETAEADQAVYGPVMEAMRLPSEDPGREVRLRGALAAAAEPPLVVAESAAEVATLAAAVRAALRPAVREDAVACVLLAEAAVRTSARLVLANLEGQPAADPLRERLEVAVARAVGTVSSLE